MSAARASRSWVRTETTSAYQSVATVRALSRTSLADKAASLTSTEEQLLQESFVPQTNNIWGNHSHKVREYAGLQTSTHKIMA
jgi:hypothetical protein